MPDSDSDSDNEQSNVDNGNDDESPLCFQKVSNDPESYYDDELDDETFVHVTEFQEKKRRETSFEDSDSFFSPTKKATQNGNQRKKEDE